MRKQKVNKECGAVMAEFVLGFPLLMLLILGTIDSAMYLSATMRFREAVSASAREVASLAGDTLEECRAEAEEIVQQHLAAQRLKDGAATLSPVSSTVPEARFIQLSVERTNSPASWLWQLGKSRTDVVISLEHPSACQV